MARYIDADEQKRYLECGKMLVEGFEKGTQGEPNTELTEKVDNIKELIDQARILMGEETSSGIACHLKESGVLAPPCKVGDYVFFLVARGEFGSLITSGAPIKRKVDEIGWDGKNFIIRSYRDMSNDLCGNLSSEWGNLVFATEEEADKRINEIREKCF